MGESNQATLGRDLVNRARKRALPPGGGSVSAAPPSRARFARSSRCRASMSRRVLLRAAVRYARLPNLYSRRSSRAWLFATAARSACQPPRLRVRKAFTERFPGTTSSAGLQPDRCLLKRRGRPNRDQPVVKVAETKPLRWLLKRCRTGAIPPNYASRRNQASAMAVETLQNWRDTTQLR